MSNRNQHRPFRLTACAAALAAILAACGKPSPTDEPATAPPPAPTRDVPAAAPTPDTLPPPDESPAAPVQPPTDAPPPSDPSPAPTPTSITEPALESMRSANATAKVGVPVDLRYSFDSEPLANQPVTLHLAAVPRVPGSRLAVAVQDVAGIQVAAAGPLDVQKASASAAYRQQYSVTRQAAAPAELRVLVTMDLPEGSAFGYFGIPLGPPLEAGTKSQKQDSVKQR